MKKRVLTAISIAIFTLAAYAQWSNPANDIPAYNAAPPKGALPPIMAGKELTGGQASSQHVGGPLLSIDRQA